MMIPTLIAAGLLVIVMAAPNAFAQGSYHHHAWCIQAPGGPECAFDTLAQCRASANGRRCVRNTPMMNHR